MRAERSRPGTVRAVAAVVLFVAAGVLSCSIEVPLSSPSDQDPVGCLLQAREAMDRGDAGSALRWAERGIAADPALEWPELREEAARAAFALGGGDFPNLLEAVAWVLEGGLISGRPARIPRWPESADPQTDPVDPMARTLLQRLDWGLVERAAVHLDTVMTALEEGRAPQDRFAGRLVDLYLAHSAFRLATGLVLLVDRNGDLGDGLQDSLIAGVESSRFGYALDSLLYLAEDRILNDLHRSLLSAENLRRVCQGDPPVGDSDGGSPGDSAPLDPDLPLDQFVEAVRAVVAWVDQAAEDSPGTTEQDTDGAGPDRAEAGPGSRWARILDLLIPRAAAASLPIRGSLQSPAVVALASSAGGFQPAGSLPEDGFRIAPGEIGWTEGTVRSLRSMLEARELLEGTEGKPLADRFLDAADASRLLEGCAAVVSIVPIRLGYRWRAVDIGLAPVGEGLARTTTGMLGSPEGWGLERLGCDLHLLLQQEEIFGRAVSAGIALRTAPRWARSSHLFVLPEPGGERSGWIATGETEVRLGLASRTSASRIGCGVVLIVPLAGEARERDPAGLWTRGAEMRIAARVPGPRLGEVGTGVLLTSAVDETEAEGRIGLDIGWRSVRTILLRAGDGWEGEIRWRGLVGSTLLQESPGGSAIRSYRLGVLRDGAGFGAGTDAISSPIGSSVFNSPAR